MFSVFLTEHNRLKDFTMLCNKLFHNVAAVEVLLLSTF